MTAKHLHAVVGAFKCVVGQKRFDNRREQSHIVGSSFTHGFVGVRQFFVNFQRHPVCKRTRTFSIGALREQHATHIGMRNDEVGFFLWIFCTRQRTHLDAFFGISARILVGNFGQTQTLHTHAQTRGIHHHKHRLQAFVRLTNQPTGCAIQIDFCGRV